MKRIITLTLSAVLLLSAPAPGAELPKRKSGLWEMKVKVDGGVAMPALQHCVDGAQDDLLGESSADCSKREVRKDGERWVADLVCKVEGSTATSRMVITGSFDGAYRVESKTSYEPPYKGVKESSLVQEAKFLGPCKPGQKPGDLVPQMGFGR